MAEPTKWTSVADFLFGTPLYDPIPLSDNRAELKQLFVANVRFDAHCPYCGRESTFDRTRGAFTDYDKERYITNHVACFQDLVVTCARSESHLVRFWILFDETSIQKVGQFPSFADIANDESEKYRNFLTKDASGELHKAIGLAAHGVGIGAFVYLRRIFEALVNSRFDEFKEVEDWNDAAFHRLRMDEKIDLLKAHLPQFMMTNRKLYSILSLGIHSLTEEQCLSAFNFIKQSIFFILEEDIKKQEELAAREEVEKAIAKYTDPASKRGVSP
jgi:hypothetical protein